MKNLFNKTLLVNNKDFLINNLVISFGISSSMGFGQTMQRSYKQGLKINVNELLLTLILVPVSAVYFGVSTAMVLCGVLPWVSVFRIRNYSKKVLLRNSS